MANDGLGNQNMLDAARSGEIGRRLLFLLGALVVYRIGTYIPVPGINPSDAGSGTGV